jgi:putative DNA primase/helicase
MKTDPTRRAPAGCVVRCSQAANVSQIGAATIPRPTHGPAAATTMSEQGGENRLLIAALALAARGMFIIPLHDVVSSGNGKCSCAGVRPNCVKPGKHPRIKDQYHKSSTDPDTIRNWWGMWPASNIGIDCGRSGLLVVDLDMHDGIDGMATWQALVNRYHLDYRTPMVVTGSGGRHIYFRMPDGLELRNSTGELGAGVDTRGAGGLVVAPPSRNSDGPYTWHTSPGKVPVPIAQLPQALVHLLARKLGRPPAPRNSHNGNGRHSNYVQAELGAEVLAVAQAVEGKRNDQLNKSAFVLGQLAGAGVLEPKVITTQLTAAAEAAGLGEHEIGPTLNSGLTDGMAEPRQLPGADETNTTDTGNGQRLAARYGDRLRHVGAWGWLVWDGRRWARDDTGELDRLAKDTARSIYAEAAAAPSDKAAEKLAAWARASLSRSKLEAMIRLAQSEAAIAARPADFDANAWILNCENGVINLRTGKLRPHHRDDHQTHLAPVSFDPAAKCELWEEFLSRIFDKDTELIEFFQRAVGYSLTGDTSEQCLFLCYGTGANGKSTTLETIRAMVGGYGQQADPTAFLVKRSDGPSNDVARMQGARLVSAIEIGEGRRLAEALVKQMTGDDTMTARLLYHEHFEFKPAFKLWMAANHKPVIHGTDLAIWRRIRLLPFTVTIPEDERDKHLPDKLRAELPGILSWAVRGCLAWQGDGLQPPDAVTQATDDYRAEMDTLALFLGDCCTRAPNAQATAADLFKAYTAWGGEDNAQQFSANLKEHGFRERRTTGGTRIWRGLGLLASE